MNEIRYTIKLLSDAEPGTGLASDLVNDRLPRDHAGNPVIPSSHLKGLMRAELKAIETLREWKPGVADTALGRADDSQSQSEAEMREARFSMTDARLVGLGKTGTIRLVSRTALTPGKKTARETALRTTETLPAGAEFEGTLRFDPSADRTVRAAVQLALLSIPAIGGGRTRGAGRCVITIGDCPGPGALLRELDGLQHRPTAPRSVARAEAAGADAGSNACVLRLVFEADSPVCCPETPLHANVIQTGFAIPASAVQGAILTRLAAADPALATACFESILLRAWPLMPVPPRKTDSGGEVPLDARAAAEAAPVRVSLTHRVAKLLDHLPEGAEPFQDEAIEPYDWEAMPAGSPLKAADGVLFHRDGKMWLWKASDMPHIIRAHGVHDDPQTQGKRNLYTLDSMAPMTWAGLLSLPDKAAKVLRELLDKDPAISFGRGRSVRGSGRLSVEPVEGMPTQWQGHRDILIAQSPIQLPDRPAKPGASAEDELKDLAGQWAKRHGFGDILKCWGCTAIRFGWNRAGLGEGTGLGRRLRARRVILPGAVIKFTAPIGDDKRLRKALVEGLGGGREQGFGALSVHPGKAKDVHRGKPSPVTLPGDKDRKAAVEAVLRLDRSRLPSQIGAVLDRLQKGGGDVAVQYVESQIDRTPRIWQTWKPIIKEVKSLLTDRTPANAAIALKLLQNIAIAKDKENRK